MTPPEYLRSLLRERGWTQVELSRRTGLSGSYLCGILHGRHRISANVAMALEPVLGISAAELLERQNQYQLAWAREVG